MSTVLSEQSVSLPESWEKEALSDVVDYFKGRKPTELTEFATDGSQPYLTADYLRSGKASQFATSSSLSSCVLCTPNDPILIWDGSNAGDCFTGAAGVLASTMVRLLPDTGRLRNDFLFFFLKSQFRVLNRNTTGSTIPHVNRNIFVNLQLPLPSLAEQRKIAGVLSVVQRTIEQQERLFQLTAELKKTLLHQLFTQGLRGESQKQTEIGLVPQSWKVVTLEELVEDAPQVNMRSEGEREIQYIDVSSISREFLRIDSTAGYVLKDAPGRARKKVKTGDVIFATVRPTLLRVARITPEHDEQVCSTAFCVLRDKNKRAIGRFIYYLAQREQFVKQLAAIESGVSYPAVTDRQVKAQLVPVPHEEEQIEIAAILEACDAKIRMHASKKQSLADLFRTLLHQLMTAQIRVNNLELRTE